MEQAIPDGFVLEKTQNIMRGTYRGISLFVVPLEVERQYQIQLYTDMEKSRKSMRGSATQDITDPIWFPF